MAVYKRGKWYWMHDFVNGVEYRMTLGTGNWQEARKVHKEKLNEIAEGKLGAVGRTAQQDFNSAADAYLEERRLHTAEKTRFTDEQRCRAVRAFFGSLQLRRIKRETIVEYQIARRKAGVSGRTVNMEVGLLRRVLKKHKQWARLADDVRMLPERPAAARVLSPEEKAHLLQTARTRPDWDIARCAAVLALTIMGIAGHVSREMLQHYSHIRLKAKREAVATLEKTVPTATTAVVEPTSVRVN